MHRFATCDIFDNTLTGLKFRYTDISVIKKLVENIQFWKNWQFSGVIITPWNVLGRTLSISPDMLFVALIVIDRMSLLLIMCYPFSFLYCMYVACFGCFAFQFFALVAYLLLLWDFVAFFNLSILFFASHMEYVLHSRRIWSAQCGQIMQGRTTSAFASGGGASWIDLAVQDFN